MLTEQDKKAIDACITRPDSVWSVIKEIAIKKYEGYLTALEPTCNTSTRKSEFKSIKDRWIAVRDNIILQTDYFGNEIFDADLSYVLKAVAQRLHGLSTEFMNIAPYMKNWRKNRTIDRRTAFIISIGFGFNIEETRKLLFTVLEDNEQMDFNPRLPNEMIYAYSIIHNIPLTAKNKRVNGNEIPQLSVQNMLHEAQYKYLSFLFGVDYADYFDGLIQICGRMINVLDSLNMTKCAFILSAIKLMRENVISADDAKLLLGNSISETTENTSSETEDNIQSARKPKLDPDISFIQRCYEFVSYYQDDGHEEHRPSIKPNYKKAQISKEHCLQVLDMVVLLLTTAPSLVDKATEGAARKIELYSTMKLYIQSCIDFVQQQPANFMFSAIDFLPLLESSGLGKYHQSEFNTMIDTIIVKKLNDDWSHPRDEDENGRSSSYHKDTPQIQGDQAKYFTFFFNALKVAVRDLRAVTARECLYLWPAYVEMNDMLKYPFFNQNGIANRLWQYECDANKRNGYTMTRDIFNDIKFFIENSQSAEDFIEDVLENIHCYEYFTQNIVSQGKQEFVKDLDEGKRIFRRSNYQLKHPSLFILKDDGTLSQDEKEDFLKCFYDYSLFRKQYYEKATAFKRNDILKLAFWDWISQEDHLQEPPKLRKVDFITYFDIDVAKNTCCAAINTNNSLDKFLLLCLEHEDPIIFLKEAIAYNNKLRTIF